MHPGRPGHFGGRPIARIETTKRFDKDLAKCRKKKPELFNAACEALKDLKKDPQPGYLRFEKLKGHEGIYTVHVTGEFKISMEFDESDAQKVLLRRLAHHDKIDSTP